MRDRRDVLIAVLTAILVFWAGLAVGQGGFRLGLPAAQAQDDESGEAGQGGGDDGSGATDPTAPVNGGGNSPTPQIPTPSLPGDPLRPGHFRVMEPAPEAETVSPDLLLGPMLAFDREGFRLGYGGGYYDRTIKALEQAGRRPRCIGLAFSGQRVEHVPREPHDVPLDAILTESGPVRLSAVVDAREEVPE